MTRIVRLLAVAGPLMATAAAFAQRGQGPRSPRLDTVASPVAGYAIIVILGIIILSISLYPSKRAHTDL